MFDLDNTLYPHHLNLWQQVDERIRAYITDFLKVSHDEAFRVQKDYYKRYGTSMRGLMTEHGMKPDDFLDFVHEIDHSPLEPNPALGAAIEKLPGRKLILTNGTRKHADAVMRRLDIHTHFEDVFDIIAADLEPKPLPQTYDTLPQEARRRSGARRDVRGSGAQSRSAARARHDHGAGGAGRHARGASARTGRWKAATPPTWITSPTIWRAFSARLRGLDITPRRPRQTGAFLHGKSRMSDLAKTIDDAFEKRNDVSPATKGAVREAVETALDLLDSGEARVAEKQRTATGRSTSGSRRRCCCRSASTTWARSRAAPAAPTWWDKVPSKFDGWGENRFRAAGFRAVPGSIVRRSAYIAPNVVLMPSFVNLGAYVDSGTMVDTWATVGSCAQIGKNCHISGGAGIGGVLEPLQAGPVIIEDNCFIGARSEVAEGVIVREGSVLSMGVFIGASTKIVDRDDRRDLHGRGAGLFGRGARRAARQADEGRRSPARASTAP